MSMQILPRIKVETFCMAPLLPTASHAALDRACTGIEGAAPGDLLAVGWTLRVENADGDFGLRPDPIQEFLQLDTDGVARTAFFSEIGPDRQADAARALATIQQEELHWDQVTQIFSHAWRGACPPDWVRLWMTPDFIAVVGELAMDCTTPAEGHIVIRAAPKVAPILLLEWPQSQHQLIEVIGAARAGCTLLAGLRDTAEARYEIASLEAIADCARF